MMMIQVTDAGTESSFLRTYVNYVELVSLWKWRKVFWVHIFHSLLLLQEIEWQMPLEVAKLKNTLFFLFAEHKSSKRREQDILFQSRREPETIVLQNLRNY